MKKLRRLIVIVLMTTLTLTFAACAAPAFEYDKDAAVKLSKEIVDDINAGDYQAVFDRMDATMQALSPVDVTQAAFDPILKESGAFVEYKDAQTSAVTQQGVDYIVVMLSCKYENAVRVYTISLTREDMLIGGLYLK